MEYFTVEEISATLGVKTSSVYHWTHIGYIPHIKLGSLVRFDKAEVLDWFEKVAIRPRNRKPLEAQNKSSR